MTKKQRLALMKKHWGKHTPDEIAEMLGVTLRTIWRYKAELGLPGFKPPDAEEFVDEFKIKRKLTAEKRKTRELAKKAVAQEQELEAALDIKHYRGEYKIPQAEANGKAEAVAILMASDWHIGEVVHKWQVNGINEFNEDICFERVGRFFRHAVKLIELSQAATCVKTLVFHIGGDIISGSIHDELMEGNRLLPIEEAVEAKMHLISGIKHLLANTNVNIVIPMSCGNHSRITKKVHVSTEHGNSLEFFVYSSIADAFEDDPRVTVMLNKGYFTYVDIWPGFTGRFHHGHAMRYLGGQSGIAGPANRMIKNWNEGRHAHMDFFCHWHQLYLHPTFVCNGSLIGAGSYSWRGGFRPEAPRQAFFLIDRSTRMVTGWNPIILSEDR